MPSCCPSLFKVPHLTNRSHRERIIQFFLRTFIFVNSIINTVTLSASAVVTVKLGLPCSCSGLTENVYMSAYTLFAVTVLYYVCMFLTCIKSRHVKSSKNLTGHVVIFLIIVVAELFITILSITQSTRVPEVLSDNAHTFASGKCLLEVESRYKCCGFRNFTEWPARLTAPGVPTHVIFQYEQLNHANITLLRNATQQYPTDVFSRSCHCVAGRSAKCVTVNYTFTFQNVTSDTAPYSWDKSTTDEPNSSSIPTGVGSATIHSTACFTKIRSQLKDMYMAIGLISILAFVAQLVVFGFHFYLTHNFEGRAAVSDIYRPSVQNYAQYSHPRSAKVTFLDLNIIQAESQNEHRGGSNMTSESSMSTVKAAMRDVSPTELQDLGGSIRLNDISPKELKNVDGSIRLNDVSPKELMDVDGSVRLNDVSPKELKNVDGSIRLNDVSPKELKDVDGSVRLNDVSPKGAKVVDGSIKHGGVAVVQCSMSINITF